LTQVVISKERMQQFRSFWDRLLINVQK